MDSSIREYEHTDPRVRGHAAGNHDTSWQSMTLKRFNGFATSVWFWYVFALANASSRDLIQTTTSWSTCKISEIIPDTMRILLYLFYLFGLASAGPAAYGICQAGCAAVVMACYSAAGCTWGATMGASAPASIIACNSAFGTCQAACASVLIAPTLWIVRKSLSNTDISARSSLRVCEICLRLHHWNLRAPNCLSSQCGKLLSWGEHSTRCWSRQYLNMKFDPDFPKLYIHYWMDWTWLRNFSLISWWTFVAASSMYTGNNNCYSRGVIPCTFL